MTALLKIDRVVSRDHVLAENVEPESVIPLPFFIEEDAYDPDNRMVSVVRASIADLMSHDMAVSHMHRVPDGANITVHPNGTSSDIMFNRMLGWGLEEGDVIRHCLLRAQDHFSVNGLVFIPSQDILWKYTPDGIQCLADGVLVERIPIEAHIELFGMDGGVFGAGRIIHIGIPRSGMPHYLEEGMMVTFKGKAGKGQDHVLPCGKQVQYVNFKRITGRLHEMA